MVYLRNDAMLTFMKWFKRILVSKGLLSPVQPQDLGSTSTPDLRTKKIEKGAQDFAERFEEVMKELSQG